MTTRDDDLNVRPGRIGDTRAPTRRSQSFVGQVMRAVRKAGHTGPGFGGGSRASNRSRFGRGRAAAAQAALRSPSRRVVIKARVVRHQGTRFRSASLATHICYLQRDGVTRVGAKAQLFGAGTDNADGRDFAERCADDRHHFRFIVSPEDAPALADLKAWTRDLMRQAEQDLGSRLDWVAVDHWNTDNPHVHVLVRGRAQDGGDLVISRDYISRGFRGRAEALVELELGPRTEKEIRSALEAEVGAERWTGLDRALRAAADEGGGILDLRPGGADAADPELRRLMIGRAQTLERFGLADRHGPAVWTLKPGMEETLRDLGTRGDIIRTMHRAMQGLGAERAAGDFAIHGDRPEPIIGRLSDALGTATEIRDSRNYAGHRLSPWLGHLMVSRQETARPLLTPGEVMQLPPTDEIVLVSGCPPIRALKARYYEDRQLRARVVAPPDPVSVEPSVPRPDDWSALKPPAFEAAKSASAAIDNTEGGIRREPTLPEHEQIAPEPGPPSDKEFVFSEDEQDDDVARTRALAARARRLVRQAALDPDDGIAL